MCTSHILSPHWAITESTAPSCLHGTAPIVLFSWRFFIFFLRAVQIHNMKVCNDLKGKWLNRDQRDSIKSSGSSLWEVQLILQNKEAVVKLNGRALLLTVFKRLVTECLLCLLFVYSYLDRKWIPQYLWQHVEKTQLQLMVPSWKHVNDSYLWRESVSLMNDRFSKQDLPFKPLQSISADR